MNFAYGGFYFPAKQDQFFNFETSSQVWINAKNHNELLNIAASSYSEYSKFSKESPYFKGKRSRKWNNPDAIKLINQQPNANIIKLGYDFSLIVNHWNYRFNHRYLPVIERHGFKFNQITDTELCEQLRDPLFGTGCNEFPDWRDESDMEKYNHALRKFQEYEKAMKLIEGMN